MDFGLVFCSRPQRRSNRTGVFRRLCSFSAFGGFRGLSVRTFSQVVFPAVSGVCLLRYGRFCRESLRFPYVCALASMQNKAFPVPPRCASNSASAFRRYAFASKFSTGMPVAYAFTSKFSTSDFLFGFSWRRVTPAASSILRDACVAGVSRYLSER